MKNELTQGIKQMYEEAGQIGHTGMRRLLLDVRAALDTQAAEIAALKADYLRACQTIAAMHEAATGRTGEAPWLGVVEDVAALKAERDALREDALRYRWLRGGNDSQQYEAEKWMTYMDPERLDAEIDDAMKTQGVSP